MSPKIDATAAFWIEIRNCHLPIFLLTFLRPRVSSEPLRSSVLSPRSERSVSQSDQWQAGWPLDRTFSLPPPPSSYFFSTPLEKSTKVNVWKVNKSQRSSNHNPPAIAPWNSDLNSDQAVFLMIWKTVTSVHQDCPEPKPNIQKSQLSWQPLIWISKLTLTFQTVTLFWHSLSKEFKMSLKFYFCSWRQVRGQKDFEKLGTNLAGGFACWQQFLFFRFCSDKEQGQQRSLLNSRDCVKHTRRAAEFLRKWELEECLAANRQLPTWVFISFFEFKATHLGCPKGSRNSEYLQNFGKLLLKIQLPMWAARRAQEFLWNKDSSFQNISLRNQPEATSTGKGGLCHPPPKFQAFGCPRWSVLGW